MAGSLKEQQGSTTACVTSGGSVSSAAAQIANGASNLTNSTNLDNTVIARLVAACGSAPVQGTFVQLYLVPISDGTNGAGVDTVTPYFNPNYFVGNFVWPAASAATSQRMDIPGIQLEAYDYIPYIVNGLGQTISSTWTLTFYGTRGQYT